MLLLGLLLLAATGAFTGLVVSDNVSGGPDYTVTILNNAVATVNTLAAFLAGIGMALIFCLGLALTFRGLARRRRYGGAGAAVPPPPDTVIAPRIPVEVPKSAMSESPTSESATAEESATERLRHRFGP